MKRRTYYSIVLLIGFIIMFGIASASDYSPHKQNNPLSFSVTSNNATSCNVTTLDYPNGVLSINRQMSKNSQTFNVTINSSYFSTLGDYCFNIECSDGSQIESGSICRNITPSGYDKIGTFFFVFIIIIALVFTIGTVLKNNWIMMLGSILVLIFGFFIIINGVDIIKDTKTTWAIGLIVWALGIYFMYLSLEEALKEWN